MSQTLFDKIWDKHVVTKTENGMDVLYIDHHYIHEVTSPQAFATLQERNIPVFRPKQTIATADHNVPTIDQHLPIKDKLSALQVNTLTKNCDKHQVELFGLGHEWQGIIHVIGPELGITQPGKTYVCGDSHTSTHGAFGCIAFGIGTSQVGQVLATQCLLQRKPKQMRITIEGDLQKGVTAKDVILYIISQLGTGGGTGYFIEYAGSTILDLGMEDRMTICNMSIEMGARGGMIAPDKKTIDYLKGRTYAPQGTAFVEASNDWLQLVSDEEAIFDQEHFFDAKDIRPMISYGTNPGMSIGIDQQIPAKNEHENNSNTESLHKSLNYMGWSGGEAILDKPIDYVFIGSCTNSRIEDLRIVAEFIEGMFKAENVKVFIVPGSQQVLKSVKDEGLDKIFAAAGFELREPGCSACLGMNEDKIPSGAYCVSTSNRNFEGRQGPGARTLLASPLTAAACAIEGKVTDVRKYLI